MEFKLIGPTSSQTIDINWLEVKTDRGSFVIQRGHAPTIVIVSSNQELTMELIDGSITLMSIPGGILEVLRDSVKLLLTHE